MLVSSFCASRPRDATRRMSATELVLRSSVASQRQLRRVAAAAPSQQQLRRSSTTTYVPSTQMVVSSSRPSSRCCWQHLEEGPRCYLEEGRELRAAAAPSQQHQLRRSSSSRRHATAVCMAVSCDDERSTGAFLLKLSHTTT